MLPPPWPRGLRGPLRPAPPPARHLCGAGRVRVKSLGCGLRGGLPASTAGRVRGGYGESAGSIFGPSTRNAVS